MEFQIRYKSGRDSWWSTSEFTSAQFKSPSLITSFDIFYDDLRDGLWIEINYAAPLDEVAEESESIVCALGETYRWQLVDEQDLNELVWVKQQVDSKMRTMIFKYEGEIINAVKIHTLADEYLTDAQIDNIRPLIADLYAVLSAEARIKAPEDTTEDVLLDTLSERMGIPVGVLKDTVELYDSLNELEVVQGEEGEADSEEEEMGRQRGGEQYE